MWTKEGLTDRQSPADGSVCVQVACGVELRGLNGNRDESPKATEEMNQSCTYCSCQEQTKCDEGVLAASHT